MLLPNFFLFHGAAKIVGSYSESAIAHPEWLALSALDKKMTEQ